MCEPITATAAAVPAWLSYATLGLSALGTAAGVVSQVQQGRYQAAVARNNAALAEMQARDAERRGRIAEDQQRRRTAQVLGTQRAVLAGQGTALDEGSPLSILGDTAATGELDALTIRSNAAREAWGLRARANNFAAQSRMAEPGFLGTGASLLGGASSVADRWLRYRRAGLV